MPERAEEERLMRRIHLHPAAMGGALFLWLAAAALADAQLDVAKAKYAESDHLIRQEAARAQESLLDHYGRALDAAAKERQQLGRLDDFLAVKKEQDRLALEMSIPEPSPELPGDVAKLQDAAKLNMERIQQGEVRRRADLARRYLDFLDRQVQQLTIAGQIEAATEVNTEKKRVETIHADLAAKLPPPEPSPAPVPVATAKPAPLPAGRTLDPSGDPKRRIAFRPPAKDMELCLTFEKGLTDRIKTPKITWVNAEVIEDGRFGKGCRFSGNGRISIESLPIPDEGSLCIWARISPTADLIQHTSIIDANGIGFSVREGALHCAFYDGVSPQVGQTTPVQGEWMHLAVTWGNRERRFYADGKLVTTVGYSGKPWAAKRTMQLGTRWTGSERHFIGDVDELLFYSRCLSPEEIATVAANDGGGK
jgi:hypothetical protein